MPIDPNALPPQRQGPDQPTLPGMENLPTQPVINRQDIYMTTVLQRNFEALASLSGQISRNLGGTGELLQKNLGHMDDMTNSAQRLNVATAQQADQNRAILEFAQARAEAEERVSKAIDEASRGNKDNLRVQLQMAGMSKRGGDEITYLTPEGRVAKMSVDEFVKTKNTDIKEQISTGMAGAQPGKFQLAQLIGHLAHGNIGGAVGELLQSLPGAGGFAAGAQTVGARVATEGALGGLIPGGGKLADLLGGGIASAGEFAVSPAAAYLIQREVRQGIRAYQENLRTGMQTGATGMGAVRESLGAGVRAQISGLNPFDTLTRGMAMQIARGIESEGFAGPIRAAWQDSVSDVVKSTGMDAGQALQLMSTSVNQFGETSRDFNQNMRMMMQVTKDTNLSILTTTKALQDLQASVFPTGGRAGAEAIAVPGATLAAAAGGVVRRGGIAALTRDPLHWRQLVARAGINPAHAFDREVTSQFNSIIDKNVAKLWDIKNGRPDWARMELGDWVRAAEGFGMMPVFETYLWQGVGVQDVIDMMNVAGGRGPKHSLLAREQQRAVSTAQAAVGRQHHHRGAFGSVIHGGLHALTGAAHDIGSILGEPGKIAGKGIAEALRDAGVPSSIANQIGQKLGTGLSSISSGGLSNLQQVPIYNDFSVGATRQRYKQYLKEHFLAGMSPAEQNRILNSLNQAQSMDDVQRTAGAIAKQSYTHVTVELTPEARKLIKVRESEPANTQRYYDSRRGLAPTQGMSKP